MASQLIYRDKILLAHNAFVQIVIWQVDQSLKASQHNYKYRLAYVEEGICRLRYDNESGKGDHKHLGDKESTMYFTSLEALIASGAMSTT